MLADQNLDALFHALAHPTRRAILASLSKGPDTIVNLAEPHEMSLNAVSKHVKTLESAGLVTRSKDRTFHRITFQPQAMRPAAEWMEHYGAFWNENLASLKQSLEEK